MLDNLITAIKNNVPVEVEREVSTELSSRTSALLDTRKKEVAYSLFNRVDDEEENETDVTTVEPETDETTTSDEIENEFVDKIKDIEENTKVVFKDKSHFIVDKDTANAFVKLYESASGLNGQRLVKIATKSKRGFLKVIQLTR